MSYKSKEIAFLTDIVGFAEVIDEAVRVQEVQLAQIARAAWKTERKKGARLTTARLAGRNKILNTNSDHRDFREWNTREGWYSSQDPPCWFAETAFPCDWSWLPARSPTETALPRRPYSMFATALHTVEPVWKKPRNIKLNTVKQSNQSIEGSKYQLIEQSINQSINRSIS